jgi:hypothetical protein
LPNGTWYRRPTCDAGPPPAYARATLARFRPPPPRHIENTALQAGEPCHAAQHDMDHLGQSHTHHGITDPADRAGHIGFPRLIFSGRQSEMRAQHSRPGEPSGIIDCRFESDRHQGTHARRRHQPPAHRIRPDDRQHLAVQPGVFGPQRLAPASARSCSLAQAIRHRATRSCGIDALQAELLVRASPASRPQTAPRRPSLWVIAGR